MKMRSQIWWFFVSLRCCCLWLRNDIISLMETQISDMRYAERMARLTARKIEQTKEKQAKLGARDEDDYGLVLPPSGFKVDLPVRDAAASGRTLKQARQIRCDETLLK